MDLKDTVYNIKVPLPQKTFRGDDGLLHCAVCGRPVQARIPCVLTGRERIAGCICECVKQKNHEREEEKRRADINRHREICFNHSVMKSWTFESDDQEASELTEFAMRYVDDFANKRVDGEGILLFGPVGTGKSFFAACIANALIEKGHRVLMRNMSTLVMEMEHVGFSERKNYLESLHQYSLLVIDDLGVERQTSYMKELVYQVINERIQRGLPLIVTTNVEKHVLLGDRRTISIEEERVYDRLLEACIPKEVTGDSKRKKVLYKKLLHAEL